MPCAETAESCSRAEGGGCLAASDGCTCRTRGLVGTECLIGAVPCSAGLICGSSGRCLPPAQVGEQCYSGDDCADGLACWENKCTSNVANHLERCEHKGCVKGLYCFGRHDGTRTCVTRATTWEEAPVTPGSCPP